MQKIEIRHQLKDPNGPPDFVHRIRYHSPLAELLRSAPVIPGVEGADLLVAIRVAPEPEPEPEAFDDECFNVAEGVQTDGEIVDAYDLKVEVLNKLGMIRQDLTNQACQDVDGHVLRDARDCAIGHLDAIVEALS